MKAIVRRAPVLLGLLGVGAAALVGAAGCALDPESPATSATSIDGLALDHENETEVGATDAELSIDANADAVDEGDAEAADVAFHGADQEAQGAGVPDGSDVAAGAGDAEDPDPYPWRRDLQPGPSDPCPGDATQKKATSIDRDQNF